MRWLLSDRAGPSEMWAMCNPQSSDCNAVTIEPTAVLARNTVGGHWSLTFRRFSTTAASSSLGATTNDVTIEQKQRTLLIGSGACCDQED